MAIVKMSRFNLLAFDSERENLLQELQKFNYVHFLDLNKDDSYKEIGLTNVEVPESIVAVDEEIAKVRNGIETLSKYQIKDSSIKAMREGTEAMEFEKLESKALQIDYGGICEQLRGINLNIEEVTQDISKINAAINELTPWIKLESPVNDLSSFSKVEAMLGTIPKKLRRKVENDLIDNKYTYFEILSEDKDNIYVLIITSLEESIQVKDILRSSSFSEIKIGIEDEPAKKISELKLSISQLENKISDSKKRQKYLSTNLPNLQIVYEYLMNKKLRLTSSENFLTTDNVNVIEGYIPTDMSNEFTQIVKTSLGNVYYLELEEADKDGANVPILLKNSKFVRAFESLTNMYSLPKYNEIDPTPFLAPFYSFFFGMMVADVGYGLIMLIGTFLVLKLFSLAEERKDFVRFFYYHSFFTILWGLIYGSFFAFSIPTGIIDPGTQYNQILIISVAFGIVHIYSGLGIKAYLNIKEGKYLDALYDTGFWYMALTGGILLLSGTIATLPSIVVTISKYLMIVGMAGIILTGGRDSSSLAGRLAGGLYSLYGISSYVGDFVSYSRLMALGLSGGFIAAAINDMVFMLFDLGIFGVIGGIVVFIGGQLFNVFLSLLSAYVHAIRLTYVEFFGKFYEGGGKVFKLLRSKPKYISIK